MATRQFLCKALSFSKFLSKRRPLNSSSSQSKHKNSDAIATHPKFRKFTTLLHTPSQEISNTTTMVFHLEGALLKSSSLFPYCMLVAFETGGLFILFLLYPLVWLLGKEHDLKVTVFVSFVGMRRKSFMVGSSVLPKFLLEDVGNEGLNAVMGGSAGTGKRRITVSEMPRIMVECFLKDYMSVDAVVGRELKVVCGYFVGLMKGK